MSCPPQKEILSSSLNTLAKNLNETSTSKGFWPKDEENFKKELSSYLRKDAVLETDKMVEEIMSLAKKHKAWDLEKIIAQKLLLEITEIGEAYEALRKGNAPDEHIPSKPSFDIECADGLIRHLDLCHEIGVDIGEAVKLKSEYNKNRPFLHNKKF